MFQFIREIPNTVLSLPCSTILTKWRLILSSFLIHCSIIFLATYLVYYVWPTGQNDTRTEPMITYHLVSSFSASFDSILGEPGDMTLV